MSYVLGGQGKHDVFTITKSGELQVPKDASLLWGGGSVDRILNEEADLLGNAILASGGRLRRGRRDAPARASGRDRVQRLQLLCGPRARTHALSRAPTRALPRTSWIGGHTARLQHRQRHGPLPSPRLLMSTMPFYLAFGPAACMLPAAFSHGRWPNVRRIAYRGGEAELHSDRGHEQPGHPAGLPPQPKND